MKIFTIGHTQTTAERFFERIERAGVATIVDVRLGNTSQLAGFAKRDDLRYLARALCGVDYREMPIFAPTRELLEDYRNDRDWEIYAQRFTSLLRARHVETTDRALLSSGCLLCSEAAPNRCHRRLVAEYLQAEWGGVEIAHL